MNFKKYLENTDVENWMSKQKFNISMIYPYNHLQIIINGKPETWILNVHEDQREVIEKIKKYYFKSKSIDKTLNLLKKFATKQTKDEIKIKLGHLTSKWIKCPNCETKFELNSGNKPGLKCPNCEEGILEIY